jgi:hypothetical protein
MRSFLQRIVSNPALLRKALLGLAMVGATVAAFYWGRMGGAPRADAQQVVPRTGATAQPQQPTSDYARRVVAYLYENVPVTREELGEYLIARFGKERIDFLVNRRIVEMDCQAKGVYVTDSEVDTQLVEDLKAIGPNVTVKEFTDQILKRWNKTLYEWKEDVIRPKLALAKLCKPLVTVTQQDLSNAYEARYGPKVQCRMIVFAKELSAKHKMDAWQKVSQGEKEFADQAKLQPIPALASKGGEIPPIHKHFGDEKIERAAFNLQPGQITPLMEMPDGTAIVLKCDRHLPADITVKFETVRYDLEKEMRDYKLAQEIPIYFAELRKKANPSILITNQVTQDRLESNVVRELRDLAAPTKGAAPRPTGPSGS